jgi:hypothetical protein
MLLFNVSSRPALGPPRLLSNDPMGTRGSVPWGGGGVKQPGREADYSPSSSDEDKEFMELYFHSPNMPLWHGAQLKHRDNFAFTFIKTGLWAQLYKR